MTVLAILDYGNFIRRMVPNAAPEKIDTLYHSAVVSPLLHSFILIIVICINWWTGPRFTPGTSIIGFIFIYKTLLGKTPLYPSSLLHAIHITLTKQDQVTLWNLPQPQQPPPLYVMPFICSSTRDWNTFQKAVKRTSSNPISNFKEPSKIQQLTLVPAGNLENVYFSFYIYFF